MPSKRTTTVVLTKKAQEIKNRLTPALGLKGILSVGLQLFDQLSDKEKIIRIAQASDEDKELPVVKIATAGMRTLSKKAFKEAIETIKQLNINQTPSTRFLLLSKEDRALIESLREVLGPESKKQKKKIKKA